MGLVATFSGFATCFAPQHLRATQKKNASNHEIWRHFYKQGCCNVWVKQVKPVRDVVMVVMVVMVSVGYWLALGLVDDLLDPVLRQVCVGVRVECLDPLVLYINNAHTHTNTTQPDPTQPNPNQSDPIQSK